MNASISSTMLSEPPPCIYPNDTGYVDYVSTYLNLVAIPTVCLLGSVAAVLCIIVFTKKQMRSSLNVYLAGLSVFDLILLSCSVLVFCPLQGCVLQGHRDTTVCHFFWSTTPWAHPINNIAQAGSVWTCVAVTVDRFLAVNYPLHSKIWCTPRRAFIILITIAVLSVLFRFPMFFELTTDNCGKLRPTSFRNVYYTKYYLTYGYFILILLIPWTTMIVLNVFVVKAVHRAYKLRRSMQGGKSSQEEKDRSASNIVIYSLFGARFRQMCVLMICGRQSRWMEWLNVGRSMVSDWDGRDGTTRKTSLDASTALLSTRSSRRWSKRSQSGHVPVTRKNTVVYTAQPNRLSLQSVPT
ncbi:unnamed protein product [Caenorhabditis bovis]|uniref:G-protein coupled receptors family 1 profile domain-containing protein n=1 Tax=Caenorhabditis bovis TaxID=2654633 RepID=A0A8S1EI99_9PELO|nr:unnamed protein product [Caenorhabditis bovis]